MTAASPANFQYPKHGSIGCNLHPTPHLTYQLYAFQYPKHGSIGCNLPHRSPLAALLRELSVP